MNANKTEKNKTKRPTEQRGGGRRAVAEAATQFKLKAENSRQDFLQKRGESSCSLPVCEFADINMILIILEVEFPDLKQWTDSTIISRRCQQILHSLSQKQLLRIYCYFVCMDVLPACVSVHARHPVHLEARKGLARPGTGVTDDDDQLMGWGSNLVLWESEQCS